MEREDRDLNREDINRGIARIEGYLFCRAEAEDAQTEAEDFAGRLPWLTGDQREELVRLYAEDRLALTRRLLLAGADRCRGHQEEHAAHYERLRQRLRRTTAAVVIAACSLTSCTLLLTHAG